MGKFARETYTVNGVKTVVYTAGSGDPLVFFHGAGTVDGFDFAEPWADRFKVVLPYHPGFGESEDDPTYTDLHDYVMHYLELFDALQLDRFNLVGLSLGGCLDLLAVPGEQVPELLVSNFEAIKKYLPDKPDLEFIGDRYREATTVARLLWERPGDPKFMRYLHRIKMPTMIVWGDEDKIIPVGQAETWRRFIPNADIRIFRGAGHLVHLERSEVVDALGRFLG
jgi:pimeloyl-ACP methyl ester carboxylesterase